MADMGEGCDRKLCLQKGCEICRQSSSLEQVHELVTHETSMSIHITVPPCERPAGWPRSLRQRESTGVVLVGLELDLEE